MPLIAFPQPVLRPVTYASMLLATNTTSVTSSDYRVLSAFSADSM